MSKDGEQSNKEAMVRRLFEAGAHFGYSKSRNHPSTKNHIFTYKNRSAVIDLEQTVAQLERARAFLRDLARQGKVVLWVGNKDEARGVVERKALELGAPYVASRWLGGTFTNFPEIKGRIDRLADLKGRRERGELSVYTKRERTHFDKEIEKLERYLSSLSNLERLPAAVVVVDSDHEKIVVKEARQTGVPVVSISNTDCDIRGVTYPIIANDASASSLKLLLDELADAYEMGQNEAVETESEKEGAGAKAGVAQA